MKVTRNVRAESFSVNLNDEEIRKIVINHVRLAINRADKENEDEKVVFQVEDYFLSATVTIVTSF